MEFLEKAPTVWDDTVVVNGEPAKYITVARRQGDSWYLGAMTNWDARDVVVPLEFLGSKECEAEIFADGPDAEKVATSVSVTKKRVNGSSELTIHLASGGGAAIILSPLAPPPQRNSLTP
jgi:alpha-glucosidase